MIKVIKKREGYWVYNHNDVFLGRIIDSYFHAEKLSISKDDLSSILAEMSEEGWVVISNGDLTEGRGRCLFGQVCKSETTAKRLGKGKYVQGTNCPIEKVPILRVKGRVYGPVNLQHPTKEDMDTDSKIAERERIIEKAKAAGLTDDDIAKIKSI